MPSSTRTPTVSTVPAESATSRARRGLWTWRATACSLRTIASSGAGSSQVVTATETPIPLRSHCAKRGRNPDSRCGRSTTPSSTSTCTGIPARGREPAHLHFDVRFLVQAEHDRFRVSDESHALAWVPAVGLDSLANEESVLRMARKWVTQRADGRCDASARPWPLERAKAPVTGARNGRVP